MDKRRELRRAERRLADERMSCASPWDIAFWKSEVIRLRNEALQELDARATICSTRTR